MNNKISTEELLSTIGRNLSAIRNAKRETQDGVARSIGVTHPVVSKIENGQYNVTLDLLTKLCNHFNVTLEQVLDFESSQVFYFTQKNQTGDHHKQYVYHEHTDGYDILVKQLQSEVEYLRSFINKNITNQEK
ncbi:helix-turn-helix domain-containing protein [Sphingobacterium spiritivorum]|uniref:helix-turn-helix domain-containing protein n=1 Tax=Sphingobacterium spiritivorum TaxID=258 RepID=UPI003DA1F878